MRTPRTSFRTLVLLSTLAVLAAVPTLAAAQAPIAVTADRVLDVASGELMTGTYVVVSNGRIEAVTDVPPADAEVIDLGDATLMPGWIDAHVHLDGQLGADAFMRPVQETAADAALRGVRHARSTLEAGFTTVRNVGSRGFTDVALRDAIRRGDIVGPRIVPSAHALSITGGHCDATGWRPGVLELTWREGVADGPWEAVAAARYQIKHGAEAIKVCATAGVLSFEESVGAQQFTEEEMRAVVEEAGRHGIAVAAHAHGTEGIKAAVRAGVASIEHGSVLDDEAIRMMRERGTFLVPTQHLRNTIPLDQLPAPIRAKAEEVLPVMRESFIRAVAAGVRIAFGTDAGVLPHGMNAGEFGDYVSAGMSPLQALQSATVVAAELLGVDDDRGRLAPGLLADLVAVPGNPLEDISVTREPVFVMKGGVVVR
jgi:imidazolonepropionase-like amidohydrolase